MDYLICSSPRVGSNLLSALLRRTDQCGTPREYLCPAEIAEHGPAAAGIASIDCDPARYQRYYDGIRRTFSKGGRFGLKAHMHQLKAALEQGFDFDRNVPDRFILLTRADVVGQAISFARALQTGAWTAAKEEQRTPRYDAAMIQSAMREILGEGEGWERLFRGYGIEPYRLSYEALVADMEGELAGVLDYLDVDPASVDLGAVVERSTGYHRRQRDGVSAEWRRRWNRDLRDHAVASQAARRAA
ncbi:MAG: Stf0 family sulfotransferase [Planctomycetota bacterium]